MLVMLNTITRFTRVLIWLTHTKKAQFTQERVEYNVFCSTTSLKAPTRLKSLKLT
jgi:hypothetical protein